jgi:two-component system phosphate regulon sensor histidine kinase PhoR
MPGGFRGRLLFASFSIVLVALLIVQAVLGPALRRSLESRVRDGLRRDAQVVAAEIEALGPGGPRAAAADSIADRFGRLFEARVTIISSDGSVVGDSRLGPDEILRAENHGDRPEVRAALAGGVGSDARSSRTLGIRMLYVAVPFDPPGSPRGVARVSLPQHDIDAEVGRQRRLLVVAAALSFAAAAAASAVASGFLSRRLRELTAVAQALGRREFGRRAPRGGRDEIAELGLALDTLASDLQNTLTHLEREKLLLQSILGGMREGLLVTDASGVIVRSNSAFDDFVRVPGPLPPGSPIEALRIPALIAALRGALERDEPTSAEIEVPGPPPRALLLHAARLSGAPRQGLVAVLHDVSEVRRLERIRQDFIANVSHELRTPVAAIQGATETLLGGALADEGQSREFIETADRQARRLARLVSDLLDLSRIESRSVPLQPSILALGDAVDPALETVASTAASRNQRIVVAPELAAVRVLADPRAVEQILANLLDNAVKYTPEGGRITVAASAEGDRIRVTVADTGPGIEAQHRERIFERFYRIDAGRSREIGGTGLGLAIVRHLVEAMGGVVGVESNPGGGSLFWFTLPAPAPSL